MATLSERAAARTATGPRTRPCVLGAAVNKLPEPLRSEAIELILDEGIPAPDAVVELGADDVGIFVSDSTIKRHRGRTCVACRKYGPIK